MAVSDERVNNVGHRSNQARKMLKPTLILPIFCSRNKET
jgi:hypothetical protein